MLSRHYITMWISFGILFTLATLGLELIEGTKITTTEYAGLMNYGLTFVIGITLFSFAAYPITFLPLTFIFHNIRLPLILKMIVFTTIGGLCGIWVFNHLYGLGDGYFIKGYDVKENSAIVIFAVTGLLYSIADHYFKQRALKA